MKQRGLLDSNPVLWGGEFGRIPGSQNKDGHEHHPFGFSTWLAGGGIKGGQVCGATDEFGYRAPVARCSVAGPHATVLDALGLNYQRLSFARHGRDEQLTDVYNPKLLKPLLA